MGSEGRARDGWDVLVMFKESPGGHVPRAEPGPVWKEVRSLSESVFSGAGVLLVNCSGRWEARGG